MTFFFYVTNPSNRTISTLVFVGSPDANDDVKMRVDGERPNVDFERDTAYYRHYELEPETRELLPILVESSSKPGNYEINATAVYVSGGEHDRERTVVALKIEPLSCSLGCLVERAWTGVVNWIIKYRNAIIAFLALLIDVLSFFGYERVRRTTGRTRLLGRESPNRDDEQK